MQHDYIRAITYNDIVQKLGQLYKDNLVDCDLETGNPVVGHHVMGRMRCPETAKCGNAKRVAGC